MKSLAYLSIAALLSVVEVKAQDPFILNPNQHLLLLNPAFAGSNGGTRAQVGAINRDPSSMHSSVISAAVDHKLSGKGALGASFVESNFLSGLLRNRSYNLGYAHEFACPDGHFRIVPALQASFLHSVLDVSSLTFEQLTAPGSMVQGPTPEALPLGRKSNVAFSSGLLVQSCGITAGFAVFNMNQPDVGLLGVRRLPARLSGHASYTKMLGDKHLMQFSYVYQKQERFENHLISVNSVLFRHLVLGTGFSSTRVAIASVGYRHNWFMLQASYGAFLQKAGSQNNSLQVQASFNMRDKDKRETLVALERM